MPTLLKPSPRAWALICADVSARLIRSEGSSRVCSTSLFISVWARKERVSQIVWQKKNRARLCRRARVGGSEVMSSALELEAHCKLHLPFAEQCAVRAGGLAEGRVEGQGRTGQVIKRRIYAGDLGSIEEVERFAQHFDFGLFADTEPTRKSQIEELYGGLLEEAARVEPEPRRTARAVHAATRSAAGKAERGRGGATGNVTGVTLS